MILKLGHMMVVLSIFAVLPNSQFSKGRVKPVHVPSANKHFFAYVDDPRAHQFDFWVGEWDVNLRVLQSDGSWKDEHQAVARIYPILNGKAIMELWREVGKENGILGYSFRYFDPNRGKWVLWLNWPGNNRSGSLSFTGEFRHGRGEFSFERRLNDSTEQRTTYTFSDITANSLRWDDEFSVDGGVTWKKNWIMEFTRRNAVPPSLQSGNLNHTNANMNLCTTKHFDLLHELSSRGMLSKDESTISFHGILGGCSTIAHLKTKEFEEYSFFSYNTYAGVYEQLVFSSEDTVARMYYGQLSDRQLVLERGRGATASKNIWMLGNTGLSIEELSQNTRRAFLFPY